jgi:hypothetical protein
MYLLKQPSYQKVGFSYETDAHPITESNNAMRHHSNITICSPLMATKIIIMNFDFKWRLFENVRSLSAAAFS